MGIGILAPTAACSPSPGVRRDSHGFSGGTLNDTQITKIHRDKQAVFEQLVKTGIRPRLGCVDLIQQCRERDIKVAFLTTTTPHTLAIIKAGLAESIDFNDFELITNMDAVDQLKPDPEVFHYALRTLGVSANPGHCDRGHQNQPAGSYPSRR